MLKAELKTKVESKEGFVEILKDDVSSDSSDPIKQKKYMMVETINADGTKGIVNVTYVHNTKTDEAWFYNVEPVSFDNATKSVSQTVIDALNAYCKKTFRAYFLIPDRIDGENQWAVVEAYELSGGSLVKKNVIVYKQGANPIAHIDIV